jgi:excisionase family DNA binding protein
VPADGNLENRLERIEALVERFVAGAATSRWLTVAEAAKYSRLSPESIRRLLGSAKLTAHYPRRGRILIDRVQLDAHIAGSTRRPVGGRGQKI